MCVSKSVGSCDIYMSDSRVFSDLLYSPCETKSVPFQKASCLNLICTLARQLIKYSQKRTLRKALVTNKRKFQFTSDKYINGIWYSSEIVSVSVLETA